MALQRRMTFSSYLPYAFLATAAVVGIPMISMLVLLESDGRPSLFLVALAGTLISIAISVVGALLWQRRTDSLDVSFGELMLWSFLRRWMSERKLVEGERLLGIEDDGSVEPNLSRSDQLELLHELNAALESKDPYTHGHSRRVERHCYRTALQMTLSVTDIEHLRKAAALHDVGKIRVPDHILRKRGSLTSDERAMVELHPVVGARMVSDVGNDDVIAAVRHHHERWDGAGYPDGLSGNGIPLFARIIAVADAYDAMISTRPYRAGLHRAQAIEELRAGAGRQFDPDVVEAFLETLPLPVPIAGLFPFVLGGRRAFKEMSFFAKRAGATNTLSSAAAAGAAVVIGAATLMPGAAADPKERSRDVPVARSTIARDDVVSAGAPDVRGDHGDKTKTKVKGVRIERDPAGAPQRSQRQRRSAPAAQTQPPKPPQPPQQEQSAAQPAQNPTTQPAAPTDPQPDKGRDCDKNAKGNGKGHSYHCG